MPEQRSHEPYKRSGALHGRPVNSSATAHGRGRHIRPPVSLRDRPAHVQGRVQGRMPAWRVRIPPSPPSPHGERFARRSGSRLCKARSGSRIPRKGPSRPCDGPLRSRGAGIAPQGSGTFPTPCQRTPCRPWAAPRARRNRHGRDTRHAPEAVLVRTRPRHGAGGARHRSCSSSLDPHARAAAPPA